MTKNEMPTGARRFGYFLSIVINFGLLYVANNLLNWNINFLTADFSKVLWVINLSFSVTIFTHFIFLFFDRKWFKNLMQALENVFAFISGFIFRQVFPLDVSSSLARLINIGLIILLVIILISILSELISAIKHYQKTNY